MRNKIAYGKSCRQFGTSPYLRTSTVLAYERWRLTSNYRAIVVTASALQRCTAIQTYLAAAAFHCLGVALRAANLLMRSIQRETSHVVVKGGGSPRADCVTRLTFFFLTRLHELAAVYVFVAFVT